MRRASEWDDDDDELDTRVFFKPQPEEHGAYDPMVRHVVRTVRAITAQPQQPVPVPPVRTPRGTQPTPMMSLLADDAYSIPSLANELEPEPPAATLAIRRQRRAITATQLAIASACALVGIAIGGVIAFSGRTKLATAPAPKPVIAPITVSPIAPAPAPAPR